MTRGIDIRLPNVRKGDHGLVQEDQGERRYVWCCCVNVRMIYCMRARRDVIHAPHALLQLAISRGCLVKDNTHNYNNVSDYYIYTTKSQLI